MAGYLSLSQNSHRLILPIPALAQLLRPDYVPEGTYFTGYLLGGIVVSTALGAADENSTPVNIQLKGRGNLAKQNGLDISKCRIIGSAYGDLSSERAFIRLEKMVCEEDGMYITSEIAGDVHGPDGFNGIKGTVVSTGAKHIKNAAIGGLISGLAGSAKGQEGINITSGGFCRCEQIVDIFIVYLIITAFQVEEIFLVLKIADS